MMSTQTSAAPTAATDKTTRQMNVPHPYRHNPYAIDHSKVYYADAECPQSAAAAYDVASPQDALYDPHSAAAYTNSSPYNSNYNTNSAIQSQYHSYTMVNKMVVPTEPVNYDPSRFDAMYQEQEEVHHNNGDGNGVDEDYTYSEENQSFNNSTYQCDEDPLAPVYTQMPPQGTLHMCLASRMKFCLYPNVAFNLPEPRLPKHKLVRMFIGQLPYNVTEMQLGWLMYTFGAGAMMYHFERITKTDHNKGGIKVPTGCFHFHMEAEQVAPLLQFLNDRLLVDDTGVWVADDLQEKEMLNRYCHGMKIDKTRRFQGRPYGTVVAQMATSTFNPDTHGPRNFALRR